MNNRSTWRVRVLAVCIPLSLTLTAVFFAWRTHRRWQGKGLNKLAWEASFTEHGLPVPPRGPREGYWGERRGKTVHDPAVGWHDPEMHIPNFYEMDALGMQHAGLACAPYHILIIGGSVAEGTYASSIATTYFEQLSHTLAQHGIQARLTILAGGSWTSDNEISAFARRGLPLKPDLVVFMNGLTDLTLLSDRSESARADHYLYNMRRVCDLGAKKHVKLVFTLCPFLPEKKVKSRIEKRILEISYSDVPALMRSWEQMRLGLEQLARRPGVEFIDCSRAMDPEPATVFSDLWHFADRGHELLGESLGRELSQFLSQDRKAHQGCSP